MLIGPSAFCLCKRQRARRRHSAARSKVSRKTAFFPRNARPYGLEREAFQREMLLDRKKRKNGDVSWKTSGQAVTVSRCRPQRGYTIGILRNLWARSDSCAFCIFATGICQAEGFSEPAHALLLLPRQFYGATLSGHGLRSLEKFGISKFYAGHSLS